MKKVLAFDDLDYARDQTETPASHTGVLVGWQGRWVKLDLSDANYRMLASQYGDLREIGEPVTGTEAAASARVQKAVQPRQGRRAGRRPDTYYSGLVAWTYENKILKKDGTGRLAYEGAREGRHDYPDWLIRDYDAYLEKQDEAGHSQAG